MGITEIKSISKEATVFVLLDGVLYKLSNVIDIKLDIDHNDKHYVKEGHFYGIGKVDYFDVSPWTVSSYELNVMGYGEVEVMPGKLTDAEVEDLILTWI